MSLDISPVVSSMTPLIDGVNIPNGIIHCLLGKLSMMSASNFLHSDPKARLTLLRNASMLGQKEYKNRVYVPCIVFYPLALSKTGDIQSAA